jgi:type II secretory pathway pseudopilin PulG
MRLAGFTLIELVIYMAILAVVSAGLISAFSIFLRHQINARLTAELSAEVEDASRQFRDHLAGADMITLLGAGPQTCAITTHHGFTERNGLALASQEKITASHFGGIGGGSSRTLSLWVLASGQPMAETLLDFGTSEPGRRWQVMIDASGQVMLDISGTSIRGETNLRDGNIHHLMLVFDASIDVHLTPASLAIHINGAPEPLTASQGVPLAVDTDTSSAMILGGGRSGSGFSGILGAVKLWRKALEPADIWPEVLSVGAVDRDGLVLELPLETSLDDTSGAGRVMTGPSQLTFTSRHRSHARKTTFHFAPDGTDPDMHLLWRKTHLTGLRNPPPDRCTPPGEGWHQSGTQRWRLRQGTPFALEDGIIKIRADIARKVTDRIITKPGEISIPIRPRAELTNLCRITPGISGFETGTRPMALALIQIAPAHHEPDGDALIIEDGKSTRQGPLQRVSGGGTITYFSYKNISASGGVIWGGVTAEYVPATGVMTICTASETHCGNPDLQSRHGLDAWADVFELVHLTSSRETYHPSKRFTFTLSDGSPPGTDHMLTQERVINTGAFFTHCP